MFKIHHGSIISVLNIYPSMECYENMSVNEIFVKVRGKKQTVKISLKPVKKMAILALKRNLLKCETEIDKLWDGKSLGLLHCEYF